MVEGTDVLFFGWFLELEYFGGFCLDVCAFWVLGVGGLLVFGLGAVLLAEFLRRVMRLFCRVSDLVIGGGRSLALSSLLES